MAKAKDPMAGMTEAQKAYEAKRAAKAGMSLDKWMAQKEKAAREAAKAAATAATPPKPKKKGLIGRMLDRARGEG
jgi:sRNA-binding protein